MGQNSFRLLEACSPPPSAAAACARPTGGRAPPSWPSGSTTSTPAVVIWQEAEIGDDGRRGPPGQATPPGPLAPARRTRRRRRRLRGLPRRRATRSTRTSRSTRPRPRCSCTPPRSPGTPNAAELSHTAVLVQDLMMAIMQRDRRRLRVPELRAAVPRRHLHDHAGDLPLRRHQRVHPPGRRRGAVPPHRGRALHRRVHHGPDDRPRSSRSTPTAATTSRACARSAAGRRWNEMITVDTRRGPASRPASARPRSWACSPSTRGAASSRAPSGGRRRWCRCASSTPTATRSPPGETGEIVARGPHGDERLLRPARRDRPPPGGAAGTTPTTSAAARPTGRSASSGPRPASSSRRPRTSTRPRSRPRSRRTRRRARGRRHRRPRPDVGPEREGDRGAPRRPGGHRRRAHRALSASSIASYKKPRVVEFVPTPLPRLGWPIDYDALDAQYGGGGYPGL